MRNRYIVFGILVLWIVAISGCGKDEGLTAPSGSAITINPSAVSWTGISASSCPSIDYNDEVFAITVKNSAGERMNNIDITVELALSPGSGSSLSQFLELYDGDTGLQVNSPYSTMTGDDGTKNMIVRVDHGCTYTADFSVFSGDANATATITTTVTAPATT